MPFIIKGKFKIVDVESKLTGQGIAYFAHEIRDTENRNPVSLSVASSEQLVPADFDAGITCTYTGIYYNMPAFRHQTDPFKGEVSP